MIEQITGQFLQLLQINNVLFFVIIFILIIIAYKVFQCALKAFIFGIIAASIPIAAYFMSIPLPDVLAQMSFLSRIMWFGIFGVSAYIIYFFATHTLRTIRFVLSPFRRLFREKPKVVKQSNNTIVIAKDEDEN